ncbi:MAG: NAD(P)H-hydrate epimerase [Isosphaeraceae bacterium]
MPTPPIPAPMTREQSRAVDAWAADAIGLPTLVLMENAGRGAAGILLERIGPEGKVRIACGGGNNGGDGGVVARHLALAGIDVEVAWFAPPEKLSHDAGVQYRVLRNLGIPSIDRPGEVDPGDLDAWLAGADWVVDGLLGTGLTRPVAGPLAAVIDAINRSARPVLALDLPSGLDADSGQPLGVAVRATITATFVAAKVGFGAPGAAGYTGEVRVVPIGLPIRKSGA